MTSTGNLAWVFVAGVAGGAVNSIAGGGTLLTFPALVGAGVPPIIANASNTVALSPGALSSLWAYRSHLVGLRPWIAGLMVPSIAGGLLGAWLLLQTGPDQFDEIVPFLVLGATGLFLSQRPILAWLRRNTPAEAIIEEAPAPNVKLMFYQLLVGTYGGYFGAGIGILMLAALGFMGFTQIHRMNALKHLFAVAINGTAAIAFIVKGVVNWPIALATMVGAIGGGYIGAAVAQKVPQQRVRATIGVIGIASGIWLLISR